jgi:nitrite reductase/ring-hydroxylating ferredoxin subunit
MARWVVAGQADSVPAGRGQVILIEGGRFAVFKDGQEYRVVDDSCPHQGASLGEGSVLNGNVICPWHSWSFDLKTGECPNAPSILVRSYPVRVVSGVIEFDLDGTNSAESAP